MFHAVYFTTFCIFFLDCFSEVIILEFVGGGIEARAKHHIIVPNCTVQKITEVLIKGIGIKALLAQHIIRIVLVGGIIEDCGDCKLPVLLDKLPFEFYVILYRHSDGTDREDGIESSHALTVHRTIAAAFGFLSELIQNVFYNFLCSLWRAHCPLFEAVVEQCAQAGLVSGRLVVTDSTEAHRIRMVAYCRVSTIMRSSTTVWKHKPPITQIISNGTKKTYSTAI